MNSTDALHLAYRCWDEEVIRSVIERIRHEEYSPYDGLHLIMPKDRLNFWMYAYGAILVMTYNVELPEEVPPDSDDCRSGMFSWWQLRALALEFAGTHPSVHFEPHLGRFKYHGLTHTIPKELYRVTHPAPIVPD